MGLPLKVSSERLGEARNRTCDPWFQGIGLFLHHAKFTNPEYNYMICNQHVCLYEYRKCQLRFGSLNCEFINEIHVHNDTYEGCPRKS